MRFFREKVKSFTCLKPRYMTRISCLENFVCLHKSSSATVGCLNTRVVPMSKYPSSMGESGGVAMSVFLFSRTQRSPIGSHGHLHPNLYDFKVFFMSYLDGCYKTMGFFFHFFHFFRVTLSD